MTLCLLVSTLTILTQLALSHFIRLHLSKLIEHDLIKSVVLELVASAELCGACFELIIIADNYGILAYAVFLFLMTIWWNKSWDTATACPYNILEDYVEQGGHITTVILKIGAQTIGGIASFRWVKFLWAFEICETHRGRGIDDCSADLQVHVILGFIIECILTCFCRLFSRSLSQAEPKYASQIDSFFGTSMVVLAFNYSGGYFNPVLATGLKWGCKGHSNLEHIIVYWAGSILGSMLSIKLWRIATVNEKLVDSAQKYIHIPDLSDLVQKIKTKLKKEVKED